MLRRYVCLFALAAAALGVWRLVAARPAPASAPRAALSVEEYRYFQSQAPHWRAFALKR